MGGNFTTWFNIAHESLNLEGLGKGQDPVSKLLLYSFVFSQWILGVQVNPHLFKQMFSFIQGWEKQLCLKACNEGGAPVRAMTHFDSLKCYSPENAIIKGKSRIQETLTLTTCADNSIVSKTNRNIWVLFGTPPRF